MPDILGPASTNAVTTRPPRSIVRGANATWFKDCTDPALKDGTALPADWFNDLMAQARVAIAESGINADGADDMLWRAMLSAGLRYAVAGGSANALTAAFPASPILTLIAGKAVLLVKIATTNTGPATLAVDGLAAKSIIHANGGAMAAGDLPADMVALLVYDGTSFQLIGAISPAATIDLATAPIFPHILTSSGLLALTSGTGSVVVSTGQSWQHRGLKKFNADDYLIGARTFGTSASKTYHLRWHAPGTGDATPIGTYPNGRFVLKDIADAAYNPSAFAETNEFFDSAYDDMLIAKVVTNSGNVPTVTPLINRANLSATFSRSSYVFLGGSGAQTDSYTMNFARTPKSSIASWAENPTGGGNDGAESALFLTGLTRYAVTMQSYTIDLSVTQFYSLVYTVNVSI